jgi:cytochrome b6-f complex iron-sulfur subunit
MEATTIFILGVVAAAILAGAGILAVAVRRGPAAPSFTTGSLDRRALRRDRTRAETPAMGTAGGSVAVLADVDVEEVEAGAAEAVEAAPHTGGVAPVIEKQRISRSDYGVTRRQFFNRAILGLFGGAFLGGLGLATLAFLWPKLKGGFGTAIRVGEVEALRSKIVQSDGTIVPLFMPAAQTWLVTIDEATIPGSSFEGLPVFTTDNGGEPALMALWQRCVHLGCRVPSCVPSQGFECPCHGSKYNFHGEYRDGPAPRNMDRFEVSVEDGNLVVNTGAVIETSRATTVTIPYPQGPNCV